MSNDDWYPPSPRIIKCDRCNGPIKWEGSLDFVVSTSATLANIRHQVTWTVIQATNNRERRRRSIRCAHGPLQSGRARS